jgi:hypothetical protein
MLLGSSTGSPFIGSCFESLVQVDGIHSTRGRGYSTLHLLHHMSHFVSDYPLALLAGRIVLTRSELDVFSLCGRQGIEGVGA